MALNKIENGRTADRMRNQWRNKALRKRGYVEREARADRGVGRGVERRVGRKNQRVRVRAPRVVYVRATRV